ncbi:Transcriptional regulator of nonfermentable carbon utilization [Agyrium rufum]|nr:Transcriptional regulator of nonfermentable carbon utilization [Agyrium rufum]
MTAEAAADERSRSTSPEDSGREDGGDDGGNDEHTHDEGQNGHKAANGKDPGRPKRKKARRACYACQRAHLTCGDERPCQRCVKRGIQGQCHDGVRKKAKYLQDIPPETQYVALPASGYPYSGPTSMGDAQSFAPTDTMTSQSYPPPQMQSPTYPMYGSAAQLPPPMANMGDRSQLYSDSQSPLKSRFDNGGSPHDQPIQSLVDALQQNSPTDPPTTMDTGFQTGLLDPYNTSQYKFDTGSFDFGNHYGALEFAMLDHMSAGATEPSVADLINKANGNGYGSQTSFAMNYAQSPVNAPERFMFGPPLNPTDWRNNTSSSLRQENSFISNVRNEEPQYPHMKQEISRQETPYAFTIAQGSSSLASPNSASSPQTSNTIYDDQNSPNQSTHNIPRRKSAQRHEQRIKPSTDVPDFKNRESGRPSTKKRNSSGIYEKVTQPYDYTTAFHNLIAFTKRRFSPPKVLHIAKSLASVRPSFISCTKTLNRADLVFMEQCFQRTLLEYENFISRCGTPTIVIRRTGEVAAVGKEFTHLTDWRKGVLLGKEPNRNVNFGSSSNSSSGSGGGGGGGASGASTLTKGGTNTPRLNPEVSKLDAPGSARPQPVFIGELLDDDSVIEFYEDFSRLAFEDPRGSVTTRCKLLKYKESLDLDDGGDDTRTPTSLQRKLSSSNEAGLKNSRRNESVGEAEIGELTKDGKIDCTYCWTVKRDVFDIPMLIVMNVSI